MLGALRAGDGDLWEVSSLNQARIVLGSATGQDPTHLNSMKVLYIQYKVGKNLLSLWTNLSHNSIKTKIIKFNWTQKPMAFKRAFLLKFRFFYRARNFREGLLHVCMNIPWKESFVDFDKARVIHVSRRPSAGSPGHCYPCTLLIQIWGEQIHPNKLLPRAMLLNSLPPHRLALSVQLLVLPWGVDAAHGFPPKITRSDSRWEMR